MNDFRLQNTIRGINGSTARKESSGDIAAAGSPAVTAAEPKANPQGLPRKIPRDMSSEIPPGCVYWITGLPGAGKTTLAARVWARLRLEGRPAVFLDGDRLRGIFGQRHGYDRRDRHAMAMSYAGLCRELSGQGLDVVCATVSMFEDVRRSNRQTLPLYREIYLRVPVAVRRRRHPDNLYGAAKGGAGTGSPSHIPGMDQAVEEPANPDLIIDDDGTLSVSDAVACFFARWPAPDCKDRTPEPSGDTA